MRKKTCAGLTLVENLVAIPAAMIVVVSVSSVLIFGQRALNHEWEMVSLQRDAQQAVRDIRQWTRSGNRAELDEDHHGITVYRGADWHRFWFVPDQSDLNTQYRDGEEHTLLDNVVESVSFDIDASTLSSVIMTLSLRQGDQQTEISTTIKMRNYGS